MAAEKACSLLRIYTNEFKMNESFPESICSFLSKNEPNDMKQDSFILINDFKQENHKYASQNRARRPFELIKLKLLFFFSLEMTLIHRLESFKAL